MSLDLTHSELLKKGDAFSIKVIEGFKFDMLAGKIQLVFSDKCKKKHASIANKYRSLCGSSSSGNHIFREKSVR